MKRTAFIFLSGLFFLSSCGVFLGPMSELSLQQRMSRGWKMVYEFNQAAAVATLPGTKLKLARTTDGIRCYYLFDPGNFELHYFTTNSYWNVVATGMASTFSNKIDISYDPANNALVYRNADIYRYYNNTPDFWSAATIYDYTKTVLIADSDKIIGMDMMNPSMTLLKATFKDVMSTNKWTFSNAWGFSKLEKCRNKYDNDTVIYTVYSNDITFRNELEITTLKNFGTSLLSAPIIITNIFSGGPVMESDGDKRLVMVHEKYLYLYDSAQKSMKLEYELPYYFMSYSISNIYNAEFVGDNIIFAFYHGDYPGNSVIIWTYNLSAKSFYETEVIPGIMTENLIGMDIYYDRVSYVLYLAVLYYSAGFIHGKLYMNQM